jgi:hypothetical protein
MKRANGAAKRGKPTTPGAPKRKMWDPVIVEWVDAFKDTNSQKAKDTAEAYHPCIRRSIGFLIAEDKIRITVAAHDDRGARTEPDDCEVLLTVPRPMVRRITNLRE